MNSFWLNVKLSYPDLYEKAIRFLIILFPSTNLCERAFSTLVHIKNKDRNRLDVKSDLRPKISNFNPDIEAEYSSVTQFQESQYPSTTTTCNLKLLDKLLVISSNQ